MDALALAAQNLTSPMVLCFALGAAAAFARSDLTVPEAAAKALAIYLLFAIGVKGGASVADHGVDASLVAALLAGIALSAALPVAAFALLGVVTGLSRVDRAAVAAHYGSISVVTFVAATTALESAGVQFEGFMVAVAAVMEAPAILVALILAGSRGDGDRAGGGSGLWREVALNGSIVLLVGAFAIGWISGPSGLDDISPFVVAPFKGVLCLFLLDMGLVAARGLRQGSGAISAGAAAFALMMPIIGGIVGLVAAMAIGLSPGGAALMATLSASGSYIAAPAAMRVALPEASPAIYLTLSLGITFPFNLIIGIPLYIAAAQLMIG